ncbi:YciI family protein [Catenulispora yoronensis]|uniref:YciI family protein n=1 Tax=Catenulispora yoronensis TaxID=450799 RepID=A0ABN2V2M2_9ACTN
MPKYLLSIYQPDGPPPESAVMDRIADALHQLNQELRDSGSWVFTGGLHPPSTATVVRSDGLFTDGPYIEGKECIGGIWVITAPDLDAALAWGRKAAAATTLPIEVRPFRDVEPY